MSVVPLQRSGPPLALLPTAPVHPPAAVVVAVVVYPELKVLLQRPGLDQLRLVAAAPPHPLPSDGEGGERDGNSGVHGERGVVVVLAAVVVVVVVVVAAVAARVDARGDGGSQVKHSPLIG